MTNSNETYVDEYPTCARTYATLCIHPTSGDPDSGEALIASRIMMRKRAPEPPPPFIEPSTPNSIVFTGTFAQALEYVRKGVELRCPKCGAKLFVKDGQEIGVGGPGVACSVDQRHFLISVYLSADAQRFRAKFGRRE